MLVWRSGKVVSERWEERSTILFRGSGCWLGRVRELEYYRLEASGIRPIETVASFDPPPYLSRLRD